MPLSHLTIPGRRYAALMKHLLPHFPKAEEAAFVFCQARPSPGGTEFQFLEAHPVQRQEFSFRSLYGMELTDACRARVIKRAHDLNASLLEVHSHPRASLAEFSGSDLRGFAEFVPHVWWRLKNRPYAAIVVAPGGFDSLSWISGPQHADGVLDLLVGDEHLRPTGLTFEHWRRPHEL